MTFHDILKIFRNTSFTEHYKGTRFEHLIRDWFLSDPRYNMLERVWLWEDFPSRKDFGGKDTGIDLVAKTELGEYWAIQCKCYADDTSIDKPAVDSFLATSSRSFTDPDTLQTTVFSNRVWVSTASKWNSNAEESIKNQNPPVTRISLFDLVNSSVDWDKLYNHQVGKAALQSGKSLRKHQLNAISAANIYFEEQGNDRGQLIMACGTGKTFTSLRLTEALLHNKGLVLFLVPSISLLGQSLNAWFSDAQKEIKAVCICSDTKVSKKTKNDFDDNTDSSVDIALPASTNPDTILRQLMHYRGHDGLVVVFSTYQSIDAIRTAQQAVLNATDGSFGTFDFIICDEAHRTTGVKLSNKDESNFTKVHSNDFIAARRRLYMTATPRIYGESAKTKAAQNDYILCSMNDEAIYGREFFRLNFSDAVQQGLLTDYKVLVLTVKETDIPPEILQDVKDSDNKELNYDDTTKLIGVINGLSKNLRGDNGATWDADPTFMRRAVAFCSAIGDTSKPGTSKNVAHILPQIAAKYYNTLSPDDQQRTVTVAAEHIDGSMNSSEREEKLAWLKAESDTPNECRVLTNVRCLSEGIDVPALDAVLFLSARNSQVDVVQSVGRVMRNFRKGQPGEKKYGYIIIPIVIPENANAKAALDNNQLFSVVWTILNALRSHDDCFNAEVNKIALNKNKTSKVTVAGPGLGQSVLGDAQTERDAQQIDNAEIARQLELQFGELQQGIYAKLVEKCGDRLYWENWAKEIGLIARKIIERIGRLVQSSNVHKTEFRDFVASLQKNLNPSVDDGQAIEMLAQHMITRPVFDALFQDYRFVDNNTVSRSMQQMLDLLDNEAVAQETESLDRFYQSVKTNVGNIDNLEGKQSIIKSLYEKFFKGAFPKAVEQLGIVYTPVECVDFIIHSVNDILRQEFNTSLTEENVHILDPFTGTGTFITRLLQSGLIRPEDMERKYRREIHCNELVLLAYYIADVNIESVFHDLCRRKQYLPYDGICLTDTFQTTETDDNPALFTEFFTGNNERVDRQRRTPIRIIIGNPPYSVGQRSANDNAANLSYEKLDRRIASTYAAHTNATNKNSLYDSYIKAFRWASDRIAQFPDGGIVAFISNGSWIDGNAHDGMRQCLQSEFSAIYVLNLRGNQRTSGEISRKEGGKIFGGGSRTPIAITFLVRNPNHTGPAKIHYHDIGDYLTREQKLRLVREFRSITSHKINWRIIVPNDRNDWINQRDGLFDTLIPIEPEKKFDRRAQSFFNMHSNGAKTQRDPWSYNFSVRAVEDAARQSIDFFNSTRLAISQGEIKEPDFNEVKISWTRAVLNDLEKRVEYSFDDAEIRPALYRPFCKQNLLWYQPLVERRYRVPHLFPCREAKNLLICVDATNKGYPIVTDALPDLHVNGDAQCFPLYWYEEKKTLQGSLFDEPGSEDKYIRHDGVTDWILREVRNRFGGARSITKEDIFYYVYGLLHSPDYRTRFADDLRKSLPRLPIVEKATAFVAFTKAGRSLAALHLNYDRHSPATVPDGVKVAVSAASDDYETYAIADKMRFAKMRDAEGKLVEDKSAIIFNPHITISGIPAQAYGYVVNGKSAIEWVMERYAVTVDSKTMIKNDPNAWAREHNSPRYILDLMLSVIDLSLRSVEIINKLPKLTFPAGNALST